MTEQHAEIIEFVTEDLLDDDDVEIKNDTSLFKEKVLDSIKLTTLIAYLEDTFSIKVAPIDIVFENLDTVDNMCAFIARKKQG